MLYADWGSAAATPLPVSVLGCGVRILMAEPTKRKAQKLYLESVRQGHRPAVNRKTKDGDGEPKTSGICIG